MDSPHGTSLLEYARFHGIAIDHQAVDPIDLATPLPEVEGVNHDFSDPQDAPILDFSASLNSIENKLRKEKLEVGKNAAIFLSSVLAEIASGGGGITDAEWDASLSKYRRVNDLKLESPLLTAECVNEIANFGKRPSLDTILSDPLPLEKEQTENDEGLSFPDYFLELPDEIWAEVKSEKLDCSKDTLRLLHEVRLLDEKTFARETIELFNRAVDLSENRPPRPISPLYLEPETQFTTSVRSSPAASLSQTSNIEFPCTDLDKTEAEGRSTGTIESSGSISNFDRHNCTRNSDPSLEKLDEFSSVPSANGRSQSGCQDEQRKTSRTNTPSFSSETAWENNNNTRASGDSEKHAEIDVNTSPETVPSTTAALQVDNTPSELVSVAMQAVETISKRRSLSLVGQETSEGVPSLSPEFNISTSTKEGYPSVSPYFVRDMQYHNSTGTICLSGTDTNHDPSLESLQSGMKAVNTNEASQNNDCVESLANDLMTAPTIGNSPLPLTEQELHGRQSDDMESLDPGRSVEEPSPKRLGLVHRNSVVNPLEEDRETHQGSQKKDANKEITVRESGEGSDSQQIRGRFCNMGKSNFMFSSAMSTLGTLSTFMETRGRETKRRKIESSPYFDKPPSDSVATESSTIQGQVHETHDNEKIPTDPDPDPDYNYLTPLVPQNEHQFKTPLLLIVSAVLLQSDRHLVRRLENLSPAPKLIFRDYTSFSNRGVRSKEIITEEEEHEADIIVSPQTGIILTTSQETTQVYLPGHKKKASSSSKADNSTSFDSPLRERIARVAMRYELIYVLIRLPVLETRKGPATGVDRTSPDSKSQSRPEPIATDPKTLSSIRSLTAFCALLGQFSTVIPLLVPASEAELVDWICSIAQKHTLSTAGVFPPAEESSSGVISSISSDHSKEESLPSSFSRFSYLDEETQWELFLRRAGFNPFAAQTVLGIVKTIYQRDNKQDTGPTDSSIFPDIPTTTNASTVRESMPGQAPAGLSLFIELYPSEREHLFGKIVGERVLRRVERCIVQDWQLDWALDLDVDIDMDMDMDLNS